MNYENPDIPEGINISEKHPLKDFLILVGGLFSIFLIILFLLFLLSDWLSPYLPFSLEKKLTSSFEEHFSSSTPLNSEESKIQSYLQNKVDIIAEQQDLPDNMSLTVHFVNDKTINAFATLGGNLIVHQGILEILPSENSLTMLLAHEVAHIKHRDPIKALSRGVILSLVINLITSGTDSTSIESGLSETGLLTTFSFNRDQERAADKEAIATLENIYGHTKGSASLFQAIQDNSRNHDIPEWLSTHPHTEDRINDALTLETKKDFKNSSEDQLTPLPVIILNLRDKVIHYEQPKE